MIKQTVLKFQGALGYLGFGRENDKKEGDSGNSSISESSEDDDDAAKNVYTTTGIIIPRGQAISENKVIRYTEKQVTAAIEQYKKKSSGQSHMCRVFDSKEMVSKEEL